MLRQVVDSRGEPLTIILLNEINLALQPYTSQTSLKKILYSVDASWHSSPQLDTVHRIRDCKFSTKNGK